MAEPLVHETMKLIPDDFEPPTNDLINKVGHACDGDSDETIEERCFSAALVCLEGHFTLAPPMGPLTTAKVVSMISKTLEKTHTLRKVREALSRNVAIWIWLTRIFAAAIPSLTTRSVGPLSSLNDPEKVVSPQESTALIILNHASIKEDLGTLIKLMHIARNLLVNAEPEIPQDICAAVHFDQMVYQTIILCVNVTNKKLLVTSLQQAHNWTAKHDRNKMSFWYDVLFDDDGILSVRDEVQDDGLAFRHDVAKQQVQHWLDRNSRMCDTARQLLKDYAQNHADKPPGNLAPIRPLAWNWLPEGSVIPPVDPNDNSEKINPVWKPDEEDKFEQDRAYGRVSREIDTWWLLARDPNYEEEAMAMPTVEMAQGRAETCRNNLVHRYAHSYRAEHSPPPEGGEEDLDNHESCHECHECYRHHHHEEDEHECQHSDHVGDEHEECPHEHDHGHSHSHGHGHGHTHHQHAHDHAIEQNMRHQHNHGQERALTREHEDEHNSERQHVHEHNHDHSHEHSHHDHAHDHDHEHSHHHHHDHDDHDHHHEHEHEHDYAHDYVDDLMDDEEADDDESYGDGPLTGLLTEVPNILDPKQIEALHMIIKSCILDNAGSGLTRAGENLQKTRCRMFLALDCGKSLLRELLVFIAVWDKDEQSLIFQVTTQIVEALHHSALIPYAWNALRIPKDIISPAQTVLLRLVNHMLRARGNITVVHEGKDIARDIKLVHFFFSFFRSRIVPECVALMHLQAQIREENCEPADFPVDAWDMERAKDGLAQYLDFLTTVAEMADFRPKLIDWEAVYDCVTILNGLEAAVPKKPLVELPKRSPPAEAYRGNGNPMVERPYSTGNRSESPSPPPPPMQDPAHKFAWSGIKAQCFQIIATLLQPPVGQHSPGNPHVQMQMMKYNGIVPLLNCCAYDDNNPFAKERVTICLKWLLDGCEAANNFFRELVSLAPQPNLRPPPGGSTVSTIRVDGIQGEVKVQVRSGTSAAVVEEVEDADELFVKAAGPSLNVESSPYHQRQGEASGGNGGSNLEEDFMA
ncbi:Stress response protein NST1 [Escovopsis weberi]|uniref:Ataxin-10 homolog n=1 Tax=Escovopsis weberi TaxID=150374 RepID=A0A0M9VS61_ESCWE|nr:Stress response protein NST1 [Escovopsis weberi]